MHHQWRPRCCSIKGDSNYYNGSHQEKEAPVETDKLDVAASEMTPIQKVMELTNKQSAQISAEGKKDVEQYDEYACV